MKIWTKKDKRSALSAEIKTKAWALSDCWGTREDWQSKEETQERGHKRGDTREGTQGGDTREEFDSLLNFERKASPGDKIERVEWLTWERHAESKQPVGTTHREGAGQKAEPLKPGSRSTIGTIGISQMVFNIKRANIPQKGCFRLPVLLHWVFNPIFDN